ncbi:MAG: hypothetical protein EP298_04420 [Gammaproteobacteria bacterium]|nr:MAG: hypothetical protein EP298_04420 [Gammaproteobacteria bacterium]UTW41656.1 SGNH/GDSL hydrolase family protein [bacterium SCSIO 12844]
MKAIYQKLSFKKLLVGVLFGVLCTVKITFASAGINIDVENRCFYPVTFSMGDDNLTNIEMKVTIQSSTKKLLSYVKNRSVGINAVSDRGDKLGSLIVWLHDDTWGNYMDSRDLKGDIYIDQPSMRWHSWNGTPTVTITTCKSKIDLSQSNLFNGIERVIFFGDSLSDKGTLHEYTLGVIPQSPPYYDGMFSNGDTWAVQFSNDLREKGIEASNYAVGGATTVLDVTGSLPYSLEGEYNTYTLNTTLKGWTNQDKQLAIIFIGANDYLTAKAYMTDQEVDQLTSSVINQIQSTITNLINYGVKRFIVIGLPDISFTPESQFDSKNTDSTHALALMHNQKLQQMVASLQSSYANSGMMFKYIDIASMFDELINQTDQINQEYHLLLNPALNTQSCWNGGYSTSGVSNLTQNNNSQTKLQTLINKYYVNQSVDVINVLNQLPDTADIRSAVLVANSGQLCSNPENYIFWDRVHPTSQIHNALYLYIKEKLNIKSI